MRFYLLVEKLEQFSGLMCLIQKRCQKTTYSCQIFFQSPTRGIAFMWTATGEMEDEEEREVVKRSPRDCSAPFRSSDRKPCSV